MPPQQKSGELPMLRYCGSARIGRGSWGNRISPQTSVERGQIWQPINCPHTGRDWQSPSARCIYTVDVLALRRRVFSQRSFRVTLLAAPRRLRGVSKNDFFGRRRMKDARHYCRESRGTWYKQPRLSLPLLRQRLCVLAVRNLIA